MKTYVYSTEGDFMAYTSHRETITLMEYDPDNADDNVASVFPV
jgi:hypothetical protein